MSFSESTRSLVPPWILPAATVLSALAAAVTGFVLVEPKPALDFVQHGGYFVLLTAFVLFVTALVRWWRTPGHTPRWSRADTRLLFASLLFAVLWQVNEKHGFKVLMDELVVNTTAMSMHFDREIFVPLKTHDVNGLHIVLGGIVDKRPSFFPLLISLVHDFTGYRANNVFALNAVFSVVLLFLTGRLGRRLGGQEQAGLFTVALLGGLPLLGLNATSGGFEVLNLTMIVGSMLLACRYLTRPDRVTQDALVLAAVLLAQTRYESAVFVAAVAAVLLWGWWRVRRPLWSWSLLVAPLLLMLVPLQNKVFAVNARGYWQLSEGMDKPFMLKFVSDNIGHAVRFMFTVDGFQSGSPVLSTFGLVCTIFAVVFIARRWRQLAGRPELIAFAAFALVVGANFALLLCYYWGQLDDYVATRLSLPLMLVFALASAFSVGSWIKRPSLWVPVLALPAVWAFVAGVPLAAQAEATSAFLTYQETTWQREFVRAHRGENALFILQSPLPAILERKPAMAIDVLSERAEQTQHHLAQQSYDSIYLFQRLVFDPANDTWREYEQNKLGPEFILEPVEERRFKPLYKLRLSRIVAVDLARQVPRPADWQPKFPPFHILAAGEDATPEERYVQEFLAKLP